MTAVGQLRLPAKRWPGFHSKVTKVHAEALADLSCPHLGENGCQSYDERPLICRLFGTTPRLPCPNGKRPEVMIDSRIERKIFEYFAENRHVLV
jgi:Fe-S-cluster containining protein